MAEQVYEYEEMESGAVENAWTLLTGSGTRDFVAVQVSPTVRVAIGETLGLARGEDGLGKLAAVLYAFGADVVTDTAAASDLLTALRVRQVSKKKERADGMPVFSSECAAWTAYAQENYPQIAAELLPSAASVHAKLLKKYYGGLFPDRVIRVISVVADDTNQDELGVDVTLTLAELREMLAFAEINLRLVRKAEIDTPFGAASGAGYIAAACGGDAESVARCLLKEKTQDAFRKLEYSGFYGKRSRCTATVCVDGTTYRFAVAHSLAEANAVIADIRAGRAQYDYVEVTACENGELGFGCGEDDAEMTCRLRKLGLKYIDRNRAARSADRVPGVPSLVKMWNALCRSGEAEQMNEIVEIVCGEPLEEEIVKTSDFEVVEESAEETVAEIVEEVAEEPVAEIVEETVEEPVAEVVEEVVEAPVAEVVEETVEEPVAEVIEEAAEEPVAEIVEEVAEEPVAEVVEETVEEPVAEVIEEVAEEPVAEIVEEAVDEPVAEIVEEVVEEPVAEVIEEAAEAPVAEVVEETVEEPVAEVVEETVEEAPVAEVVEEAVEEPVAEIVEEVAEEPVAEVIEEVAEEPVAEVVEEVVEEPVAEVVEEVAEEAPVADTPVEFVEEAPVEEAPIEETAGKKQAYYTRMSTKDRRKMKRMKNRR